MVKGNVREEIPVENKRLKYRQDQHEALNEGEFVPMFYSNQEFLGVSIVRLKYS